MPESIDGKVIKKTRIVESTTRNAQDFPSIERMETCSFKKMYATAAKGAKAAMEWTIIECKWIFCLLIFRPIYIFQEAVETKMEEAA